MPAPPSEKAPAVPTCENDDITSKAEYYRLIAEHVSDVVCLHAPDGAFLFVSPSVHDFLGYEPGDLLGTSPYELVHPDDARAIVRPNHEALLRKEPELFRCRFRHKEGHYLSVEVTNDFITDESGEIVMLVTSARDLSRRKKLEDRVRLFETIVEKASDVMLVTDTEERIRYVNPTFEERTGYSFEDVKGRVPGEVLQGPDTDPEVVKQMRETLNNRQTGQFELLNYTKDGVPFHARIHIQPMLNEHGEHEGFFALQQDITEEKASRERLDDLNKELERFAYVASHDLKEPLRNIVGLLDLLEDGHRDQLNEEGREIVGLAKTAAGRMTDMIATLLEFARTGTPSAPPEDVRIGDLVEAVRNDLSRLIEEREASVSFAGKNVVISGYKTALYRLIQNLVSNSLKHFSGPGTPQVEIHLVDKADDWMISVEDNGPGIPDADREKIFQLFNRVSRSGDSNGMGLALCRRIAELHNGCIDLITTKGEGARFEIHISKNLSESHSDS